MSRNKGSILLLVSLCLVLGMGATAVAKKNDSIRKVDMSEKFWKCNNKTGIGEDYTCYYIIN